MKKIPIAHRKFELMCDRLFLLNLNFDISLYNLALLRATFMSSIADKAASIYFCSSSSFLAVCAASIASVKSSVASASAESLGTSQLCSE
jgi:hypothetical protein